MVDVVSAVLVNSLVIFQGERWFWVDWKSLAEYVGRKSSTLKMLKDSDD